MPNIEVYERHGFHLRGEYVTLNGQQGSGPVTARFQKTGHIKDPNNLAYAVAQAFNVVSDGLYSRKEGDHTKVVGYIAQTEKPVASVTSEDKHLIVKFYRNRQVSPFDVLRVLSRL